MEVGTATLVQHQYKTIIYAKLNQKYAQLNEIDSKNQQNEDINYNDFFEVGNKKYDKNDYERVLQKFKQKDNEIRRHEASHSQILGQKVSYKYQIGPDGKMYAVGGETVLDTSLPQDPNNALNKIEQIKKAATASSSLSSADLYIVNSANIVKAKLSAQL
jgi:hypothetical protein